ncbi:MAG: HAD family hydrolase [Desulfomonile tiedjei]|uniref:D,D-heptose 1,7-bisphosphate phosphatase n=1 Tax=Desulfomonile tiedjei TaxID=2358 RepID=A0A9D6Z431_9BACT|nr:HAD family hydrolase [Desulfomonile tiedjei]
MGRKAIFLDRDGVINSKLPEDNYVSSVSAFEFLPGVFDALIVLQELGFILIVITNQRGIARGFMSEADLERVHSHMHSELQKHGICLEAIYHCPHEKSEFCDCRKPEPGMILTAGRDYDIDLSSSYMVGDSPSDTAAGRRAGVCSIRIGSDPDENAASAFESLLEFALHLKREADGELGDSSHTRSG